MATLCWPYGKGERPLQLGADDQSGHGLWRMLMGRAAGRSVRDSRAVAEVLACRKLVALGGCGAARAVEVVAGRWLLLLGQRSGWNEVKVGSRCFKPELLVHTLCNDAYMHRPCRPRRATVVSGSRVLWQTV